MRDEGAGERVSVRGRGLMLRLGDGGRGEMTGSVKEADPTL